MTKPSDPSSSYYVKSTHRKKTHYIGKLPIKFTQFSWEASLVSSMRNISIFVDIIFTQNQPRETSPKGDHGLRGPPGESVLDQPSAKPSLLLQKSCPGGSHRLFRSPWQGNYPPNKSRVHEELKTYLILRTSGL